MKLGIFTYNMKYVLKRPKKMSWAARWGRDSCTNMDGKSGRNCKAAKR